MTTIVPRHETGRAPRITAASWQRHTACTPENWEQLTSEDNKVQRKAAKEVCGPCPVKSFCLQFALDTNSMGGVFGGTTARERRRMTPAQSATPKISEVVDEIVAYRRNGLTWDQVERELEFPVGTIRKRVARWVERVEAAGGTVPAELGDRNDKVLSEAQVLEIRMRAQQGETDLSQALRLDVGASSIRKIVTGERYPQYGGPLRAKRQGHASKPSAASERFFNASISPARKKAAA